MTNIEKNDADKNFSTKIENKDRVFTLFYAKWCPFSQRFLPIFNEFKDANPNECLIVALDDDPETCKDYSIKYYPTVILFKKGKVEKRLDSKPGVGLNKQQLEEFVSA